jgi:ATP-dependent helicase/nuclease subunit B
VVAFWTADGSRVSESARDAGIALLALARQLVPLQTRSPASEQFDRILFFLTTHGADILTDVSEAVTTADVDSSRNRRLRARGAILGIVRALRNAHRRFGGVIAEFEEIAAMIRRGIEAHTFSPRSGEAGVHLVDAESARFGEFDCVQLAGLVDGEWPERQRRNIFYSPAILRELGWPSDADRVDGARSAFADLLGLPAHELIASTFSLEHDAIVGPSIFVDDVAAAFERQERANRSDARIFEYEALGVEPVDLTSVCSDARHWAEWRLTAPERRPGTVGGMVPGAYSVSALERYQDCPFKFFAADILRLEELPEDEPALSPRARGRFIHEVFQRFFEEWDRRGGGAITSERIDQARRVFEDVASPLLARLPDVDASLERTRLFGSAISVGMVDVVLGFEAMRPIQIQERWLEYRLEGEFTLNGPSGREVRLKGVADRIDLLEGKRLRVIDYKSGYAPQANRVLQVPVYGLCAQERLAETRGETWTVDEAAYVAFTGKRSLVPIVKPGKPDPDTFDDARSRLFGIVDGIERGEFPPRPHEPRICGYCAYPSVCRKDYVGDE